MSTDAFDETVSRLESARAAVAAGSLTTDEYVSAALAAIATYLRHHEDPRDDVALLIDYTLHDIDSVAGDPVEGDHIASELSRRLIDFELARPALRHQFDLMLCQLEARLIVGDPSASEELKTLCREGAALHRAIFVNHGWGLEILRIARRHRNIDALHAAVDPRCRLVGRLGDPRRDGGEAFWLALDFLAEFAAQPDGGSGARAREVLVELAGHFETAAQAVVRLPARLLTHRDRQELAIVLEHFEELTGEGGVFLPLRPELFRIRVTIRSVLWHANDAERAGWVTEGQQGN